MTLGDEGFGFLSSEVSMVSPGYVNRVEPVKNNHCVPNQNQIALAKKFRHLVGSVFVFLRPLMS